MKTPTILLLSAVLMFAGCSFREKSGSADSALRSVATSGSPIQTNMVKEQAENRAVMQPVSLNDAVKSDSTTAAMERKIIRDADLTMEVPSTIETQRRVTSIAESHGGFVVTSEAKQREAVEPAKRTLDIKLVVRVPSNQFGAALNEIEGLATNLTQRNVTGQDVTEEFIDLEARLKTQKALEIQFLEIMRQAKKVADALEVQSQIADVRTEIEKLEGRRRFLESRTSLSSITVNIQSPTPIVVSTSGFGRSVREAISESIEVASGILLFLVRFVIVMVPVFALLILPAGLVARFFIRRAKRFRLAHELQATATVD
jgi:Domain of unknown function (DUF4349)